MYVIVEDHKQKCTIGCENFNQEKSIFKVSMHDYYGPRKLITLFS